MRKNTILYIILLYTTYCKAIDYNKITYIYTIDQGSFNIEGSTDCMLTKKTSFSDIVKDNKGISCSEGHKSVNCHFSNTIICTDVARVCKGKLIGGKCGAQEINQKDCCYGIIDVHGTGILGKEGKCSPLCIDMGIASSILSCKTCSCSYGHTISSSAGC